MDVPAITSFIDGGGNVLVAANSDIGPNSIDLFLCVSLCVFICPFIFHLHEHCQFVCVNDNYTLKTKLGVVYRNHCVLLSSCMSLFFQALSRKYFLNCLAFCKQIWYGAASPWSCAKNVGSCLQGQGHR